MKSAQLTYFQYVDCLERADIERCAIGGVAVNHWAEEPMVTQDVDLVVATESVEHAVTLLEEAGFKAERFDRSIAILNCGICSAESFNNSSISHPGIRGLPKCQTLPFLNCGIVTPFFLVHLNIRRS
ncbi:MAG: hypothetical protein WCS96_15210 [Victivallales bacterium]